MSSLFRPVAGGFVSSRKRLEPWYVNGTDVYRGDIVAIDTSAATDQGTSGVLDGATLGVTDFVFCALSTAATDNKKILGVVDRGDGMTSDTDTVNAISNDGIALVQTSGIHTNAQVEATNVAAGNNLGPGTTGGLAVIAATDAFDGFLCAVALVNGTDDTLGGGNYTRGTVTTAEKVAVLVRCDY
jgi:hypothetical protein